MFRDEFNALWNGHSIPSESLIPVTEHAGMMATQMFKRQYATLERDNPVLRLSALGKSSIVELLAKKFGLIPQGGDDTVSNECRLRFVTGDLFECQAYIFLSSLGFEVLQTQTDIDWHGVKGHSDFIVKTPSGVKYLIELKTANNYYFKEIKKFIGDERGYLTQLCTYSDALGLPAAWMFVNKDTSEVFIKELTDVPEVHRAKAFKRALGVVKAFNNCDEYADFPLYCNVPPPKIEKYKDGTHKFWEDGSLKLYVPDHSFSGRPDLFYVVDRKKNDYHVYRNYVTDFVGYDKYPSSKPDINKFALENDAG